MNFHMKLKRALIGIAVVAWLATCDVVFAYDYNTNGYVPVKELKAWSNHIDIYFEDEQQHQCDGGLKTRFVLDPTEIGHEDRFRLVISAFLSGRSVQLAYKCGDDGFPWVEGVRVH